MSMCFFRRDISDAWRPVVRDTFVPGRHFVAVAAASVAVGLGSRQGCIRRKQQHCSKSGKHLEHHHLVDPTFQIPKWKNRLEKSPWNMLWKLKSIDVEFDERMAVRKKKIQLAPVFKRIVLSCEASKIGYLLLDLLFVLVTVEKRFPGWRSATIKINWTVIVSISEHARSSFHWKKKCRRGHSLSHI